MNPTPEQQRAIDTTDRTILLSAAAGSGKTATLTERLIRMITRKEDPLDVSRMLIVTFTRAAAEELRTRISAALSAAVMADPDNERLARQTLLLPTARIRTIDGFCNEIVKGHTETLGISPLYRIGNEAEIDLLGTRLMNEVIEDAYSGEFAPEGLDIATLVEATERVNSSGALAEELYSLYKSNIRAIPEGVVILEKNADTLMAESTVPFFETRAGKVLCRYYIDRYTVRKDTLRRMLDSLLEKEGKDCPSLRALWDKAMGLLHHYELLCEAAEHSYGALKAAIASYETVKKARVCSTDEPSEEALLFEDTVDKYAKECAAERKDSPLPWRDEDIAYAFSASADICRSVYLLLAELHARFSEEKSRRSVCDYADLASFAYRLLWDEKGERTPLAHEMAASFDTVCIDEYQDVNDIQHRIFEAISTKRNRFMVGDIKQSIYGFRGAEPDIFARLRESFPPLSANADETVLFLTQNFRSERSIIELCNGVFDFLFPIIGKSIGYVPEDRLYTEKPPADLPTPTMFLLRSPKEDPSAPEMPDPKTENDLVAEWVLWLLENGKKKDGSRVRACDIAVLCRGGMAMGALVRTLREHGIPLTTEDKTDLFAHEEILLALSLCHVVNNPHNDLHLSALLRSPLYGFTMSDLIRLREASPTGASMYDGLCAFVSAHPDFIAGKRFLADCERYRALAENTPAHRLIRTLFEETGIYAATSESGRTNLRIFYELARSYEESAYRGLYRFLQRLSEIRELGSSPIDKRQVGRADAVTVTTIHKSKGLEFPVCILAQTGIVTGGGNSTPTFRFSPALGLFSNITDKDGLATLKTPLYRAAAIAAEKKETEEAVRVLYVALTRAKEQLYIFGSSSKKHLKTMQKDAKLLRVCRSPAALAEYPAYLTWLLAALGEDDPLCRVHFLSPPYDLPVPHAPDARRAETDAPERQEPRALDDGEVSEYLARYRERFAFRYPHEAQTRLPAKLSVSSLYPGVLDELSRRSLFDEDPAATPAPVEGAEEDFTPTVPAFLSGKEENAAAKAGTATHLFLQFCDFDRVLLTDGCQAEKTVENELSRLCTGGYLTEDDASRVRQGELAAFLRSPCAEIIRKARKCYREFRFHASLPAELFTEEDPRVYEGLSVFVQGVVDILIERKDGSLLLLDYKTDRIPQNALGDTEAERRFLWSRHESQLSLYGKAIEKIFAKTPTLAIYSLHAGKLLYAPK